MAATTPKPKFSGETAAAEVASSIAVRPVVHTLRYGTPIDSLSVVHSATGDVLPYTDLVYDSGSTINMCTATWARKHNLSIDPTSPITLHTSNGTTAPTIGVVSTPLHFRFCKGHPQYDRSVVMQLHVIDCHAHVYDLLLGVPFINGCATWVDVPTSELVYRPDYMSKGDTVTMHRIPIVTTEPVKHK
jgi:hypothetical protein